MRAYDKLFLFITWCAFAFSVFVCAMCSPIVAALVATPLFAVIAIPFSAVIFGGIIFESEIN